MLKFIANKENKKKKKEKGTFQWAGKTIEADI